MEPSDVQGGHSTEGERRRSRRLGDVWGEEFLKVLGGIAMDAQECEEGDFVLNPGGDGKPV